MATHDQLSESSETGYITPDQPGGVPGWKFGIPVFRIYTCGPFTIEMLVEVPEGDPTQARYVELPPERLSGRGPGSAQTAVKLLLSQEGRYASKDWLRTHLREGEEVCATNKRLENIISHLRCHLLCLPSGKKLSNLLLYVRATNDSGDGYRLAEYPLVWVDVDALAWHVKQACLKERFGEDPFVYWQRAYDLAGRGTFLLEETSSDWAKPRREAVDDQMRQTVHALARLYLAHFGQMGEEDVLRILLPYCRTHQQDEDALRPLLELLNKRGCYQEVLEWYEHLEATLQAQGPSKAGEIRTPDSLTAEIADFARLKLRECSAKKNPEGGESLIPSSWVSTNRQDETLMQFSRDVTQGTFRSSPSVISHAYNVTMGPSPTFSQEYNRSPLCDGQIEKTDVSSSLGQRKEIQTLESGIAFMKEDRRRLLQALLNLGGGVFAAPQAFFGMALWEQLAEAVTSPSQIDDFTLTQLETITRSYWHLFLHAPSKSDLLSSFWGHLQTIFQFLKYPQSGARRNRLYSIAGESAQMIGEILFDMQEYQHAQTYYDFSIYAAKEAGNNALRAVSLGRLSFLPIYRDEPLQAYPLLEEAKQLLSSVSRPMISSWLAVVEAEMLAHLHHEVACEKALERAVVHSHQGGPEADRLWTRLNDATIPGYQGACYLQLQQPHKALVALQDTLTSIPEYSPRHRSLILADIAAAMQQMGEIEEACTLLRSALEITTQTKSLMVLMRIQRVRNNLAHWKETSYVKQLDTSISEVLPSILA